MFRNNRRQQQRDEITRFVKDTQCDMMNLTHNLREEMKLARKLSVRRIDQAAGLKPPPSIQYPHEEELDFSSSSSSAHHVPIQRYPTLAEVSKLPSSRHFSHVLDQEFEEENDWNKKPAAVPIIHEEHEDVDDDAALMFKSPTKNVESKRHPTSSHPPANIEIIEIEVFPGVFKRLRGSKETKLAWDNGLCAQTPCMVCEADLAFVHDCEFVICPECKTVVPVDVSTETSALCDSMPSLQSLQSSMSSLHLDETETNDYLPKRQGGVGLGIRIL